MGSMNWKHWLSVGLATFSGGAITYMASHLSGGIPTTQNQIAAFVVGALVAGGSAVAHLLQSSPNDPTERDVTRNLLESIKAIKAGETVPAPPPEPPVST